jgi:hypothetical protein
MERKMLRQRSMLAGLLLAGLALAPAAQAQTVPEGPYTQSCRSIAMTGGALYATCRRADGGWRMSRLNLPARCPGVIDNVDGWLKCTPAPLYGK